ncbi:hypothetical protein LIA77_08218 [Sarocladium implicatum]|nr:hypothetical protein LIA77_08218 [Sarocladium implicatum]
MLPTVLMRGWEPRSRQPPAPAFAHDLKLLIRVAVLRSPLQSCPDCIRMGRAAQDRRMFVSYPESHTLVTVINDRRQLTQARPAVPLSAYMHARMQPLRT